MAQTLNAIFLDLSKILDYGDHRLENYFLMQSPLPITLITISYVGFVFKFGPAMMKNRQAFKLDKIIMVYNLGQILLNGLIFVMALREYPKMSIYCSPVDWSSSTHAINIMNLHYYYALIKILDLLDTVFFVLRKKNKQITFLHLYHHIIMGTLTWVACKFYPGGQLYFLGVPNLFVHVVMYFYYFLTSWDADYKKSVWWKKHITQLQIVQHFFIFFAFMVPFLNPECGYSKLFLGGLATQAVIMIVLFSNFYVKTYVRSRRESSRDK